MKTLIATTLAGLCCATIAGAALPPFYASGSMMQTILGSPEVEAAAQGGFVEGLELLGAEGNGAYRWRLRTQHCSVTILLQPQPMPSKDGVPMVGRVEYTVAEVSACTAN